MAKLLIRYDVENWAVHRRALGLHKYRRSGDHVVPASNEQYASGMADGDYDAVLLCDLTACFPGQRTHNTTKRLVRFVGSHGWMYREPDPNDWRTKGVNGRNAEEAAGYVQDCDTVTVHNREQKRFFDTIHNDVRLMPYPVDMGTFKPGPSKQPGRKLRIGWCGQLGGGPSNFKGFVEVMVPLIARLGDRFDWSVNHRDYRTALTAPKLAKWYQSCDVFLCTSTAEGGPQTVFEAAACGCIVLSTEVGQVADWKWLVNEGLTTMPPRSQADIDGTVGWFVKRLKLFDTNRAMLDVVSQGVVRAVRAEYDAAKLVPEHLALIAGE